MGPWLSCFLRDRVPIGAAIYDCDPGALFLEPDGGVRPVYVKAIKPGQVRVIVPMLQLPEDELEPLAGEMLDRAARMAEGVELGIELREIEGPRGPLFVGHPEHVGVYCDFGDGRSGLALCWPRSVTIPRTIGRYEVIGGGDFLDGHLPGA